MAAKSLAELQRERGRLIERIAVQRATLGVQLVPVVHALQWGERAMQTFDNAKQFLREHPLALGSFALLFALRRPRRWGRWLRRGLFLWRSWRGLRTLAATVQRHLDRQT